MKGRDGQWNTPSSSNNPLYTGRVEVDFKTGCPTTPSLFRLQLASSSHFARHLSKQCLFSGWGHWRGPTPTHFIQSSLRGRGRERGSEETVKKIRQRLRSDTQRRHQRWWKVLTVHMLCFVSPQITTSLLFKSRTTCKDSSSDQLTLNMTCIMCCCINSQPSVFVKITKPN